MKRGKGPQRFFLAVDAAGHERTRHPTNLAVLREDVKRKFGPENLIRVIGVGMDIATHPFEIIFEEEDATIVTDPNGKAQGHLRAEAGYELLMGVKWLGGINELGFQVDVDVHG